MGGGADAAGGLIDGGVHVGMDGAGDDGAALCEGDDDGAAFVDSAVGAVDVVEADGGGDDAGRHMAEVLPEAPFDMASEGVGEFEAEGVVTDVHGVPHENGVRADYSGGAHEASAA